MDKIPGTLTPPPYPCAPPPLPALSPLSLLPPCRALRPPPPNPPALCADGWMGLDIGPDSINLLKQKLNGAKTVIWNGPMG